MKIVVFGATGDVGRETVLEAVARGHDVTAIARNREKLANLPETVTRKSVDVLAAPETVRDLIGEHDIAISALRPAAGQENLLVDMSDILLQGARATGTPLYLTGGAALLKLADGSGHTVLTAPDFLPDAVRPIAEACARQDALLDHYGDTGWTILRPPAMLGDGIKTRHYVRGTDTLVTDHDGVARISFADFAVAMVDLAESGNSRHQRLTVGYQSDLPEIEPIEFDL